MLTLCQVLTQKTGPKLSINEWDSLVRQARKSLLLAQLAETAQSSETTQLGGNGLPPQVSRHLASARTLANAHQRAVKWEFDRIESALLSVNTKIILLKGAAYLSQQMPHAQHRLYGDIDILVQSDQLEVVEERLKWAGWATTQHSAYDEKYYRRWMHEIPPLQHAKRASNLDLHHRILPPTARITVAGEPLIENAVQSKHYPFFHTLAPADQWLHSAAHLFCEGEADHGLRDLFDLLQLAQHFLNIDPNYLHQVVNRSNQLGTSRLTHYALRYIKYFLWPELSDEHANACMDKPHHLLSALMDKIFIRTLRPQHLSTQLPGTRAAAKLLYFRSHYLRMPWKLLIPHLIKKSLSQDKAAAVG